MVAPAYSNGCLIVPTYGASITSDPNAVAIEAAIQRALNQYESLFTKHITVNTYFEETTFPGPVGLSDDGTYNGSFSLLYSHLGGQRCQPRRQCGAGSKPARRQPWHRYQSPRWAGARV